MKNKLFVLLGLFSLTLVGCNRLPSFTSMSTDSSAPTTTVEDEEEPVTVEEEEEEEIVDVPHTHNFGEYQTNAYEHWRVCLECGEEERYSHDFHLVNSTAMTCKEAVTETYECEICKYSKFVKGSELDTHSYTSKITKEATCQEEGEITFHCDKCGDEFVQKFTDANAHKFITESEINGVTTLKCAHDGCHESKTIIDHSTQVAAQVNTEALKEAGEVQLQNAAIAFDEDTLNNLSENVEISATPKDHEEVINEVSLEPEEQVLLAGKPIIDFSITDKTSENEEKVSDFAGSVTVTIPYELKQGEDPNGIAIWYLSEDGKESIKATYSNGNVSFDTTHFSYYAVVHLDPKDVCREFGHEMVKGQLVPSTCATHGYDEMVCRRCGEATRSELPLVAHQYEYLEKKEPTTTEQGYVRYKCQECGDVYDAVLDVLKTDVERSFYVNLFYTAFTPEFRIYTTQTIDGQNSTYEQIMGLDYDGEPFEYNSSGSSLYKGYRYYADSYNKYKDNGSSSNSQFELYRQIIDYLPDIYKENIEEIASWVVNKYLIKSDTPEGYQFTLNIEALKETYQLLLNEELGTAIERTIGSDLYNEILDFVANHYEGTVAGLITDLEARGYLVDAAYEAIKKVAELHGGEIPPLDEILTEEIKAMKVYEFFETFFSSNHSSSAPEPIEEKTEYGLLPESYSQFKEMLDQYLEVNLFDLILEMQNSGIPEEHQMSREQFVGMIDGTINQISEENANIVLKTTKDGGFISLEETVRDLTEPGGTSHVEYVYSLITKSFDKGGAINKIKEVIARVEVREHAFDLDSNNYEWFAKAYEDYYQRSNPDFRLEYKRDYNNEGRDALVSNVTIQIQDGTTYNYDTEKEEPTYKTGKLLIILYRDYDLGSVYTNRYGFGSISSKNERVLITNSNNIVSSYQLIIETEGGLTTQSYINYRYVPSFGYAYTFKDSQYHHTAPNGSYRYLWASYYRFSLVTAQEYIDYVNEHYKNSSYRPNTENLENKYIIKHTNVLENYVYYDIYDKYEDHQFNFYSSYYSSEMNDEALELADKVEIYTFILEGSISETVRVDGYNNYYSYYNFLYTEESEFPMNETSYTASFGNMSVNYSEKNTSLDCSKAVSWKILINAKTALSNTSKLHVFSYLHLNYTETTTPTDHPCTNIINYERRCDVCNKLYDKGSYSSTNHDFSEEVTTTEEIDSCHTRYTYTRTCSRCYEKNVRSYVNSNHNYDHVEERTFTRERTYTTAGYTYNYSYCEDCGSCFDFYGFTYLRPCQHNENHHEEIDGKMMFVCDECDYICESPSGEKPELIYELFSENIDEITYTVFAPNLTNRYGSSFEYYYLNDYYKFSLCVGYEDEKGNFVAVSNNNNSELGYGRKYVEDTDGYFSSRVIAHYLTFTKVEYEELLASTQKENPDVKLVATIAAVNYDSGTIFYYAI